MIKMPQSPWTHRSLQDTQDFFARHGNSLSEVLYATTGEVGLDLFCEVKASLEELLPDPGKIGRAMRDLSDMLEQANPVDDQHDAPLRWHGAHLADLSARLPR
ncbi:hypothetical protein K3722_12190 [Leisingera caerulea]|uniref:Uncharacterized protein n=1 Tax=Leisingera caerulea TaxID=506591 RepID=A0ABY5WT35_LEICA|nr:hypothetical protein [Leisingera caerulea]UWQ57284.1 hypothetical protein K3722_12190 [Leisingera caerulea]